MLSGKHKSLTYPYVTAHNLSRHADASSNAAQSYTLTLPTSLGSLKIPALGGSLTLAKKDSKIHVVDYLAGTTTLVYSTAEILTWWGFPSCFRRGAYTNKDFR